MALILALLTLCACAGVNPHTPLELNIAHLSDTHSHLEAKPVNLTIGGVKTTLPLGGFPRLQTLMGEIRREQPDTLLLHAGDAVQGTLYFTLFNGMPEFDYLNRLGVDAMTFGNHEFDRGTAAIPGFLRRARFPFVSSNIDFAAELEIAPLVNRYLILEVAGHKIGIIGLTTETTPLTTIDVGKARFLDARGAARRMVAELERGGINKIIALSHLGYAEDLELAASTSGIDIIIGGHSHTLLGERAALAELGLLSEGEYPSAVLTPDGSRTLVAHGWQWGHLVGRLQVLFDAAGVVESYKGRVTIPVGDSYMRNGDLVSPETPEYRQIANLLEGSTVARIVGEDPEAAAELAPYREKLESYRKATVATATEDLLRALNRGPGVLGADSMLRAIPGAEVAILNYGGVRKDLLAGNVSVADLLEVMPFNNTLVLVDLSGAELKSAMEEGVDFLLRRYPGQTPPALPYVAGVTFTVAPELPVGSRIDHLEVKAGDGAYRPVDPSGIYRTVVSAFVANGGDGFRSIKHATRFRSDTGIVDSDALREHLAASGTLRNPQEERIKVRARRP